MKVRAIAILAAAPLVSAAHPQRVRKGAAARRSAIRRHLQEDKDNQNEAPAPEAAPEEKPEGEEMSLSLEIDIPTTVAPEEPVKEEDVVTTVAPEEPVKEDEELVLEEMSVPEEEDVVTTVAPEEPVKEDEELALEAMSVPEEEEPTTTEATTTEPPKEEEPEEEEMSMPEAETTEPPKETEEDDDEPAKDDEETTTETTVAAMTTEAIEMSLSMSMSMEWGVDDQPIVEEWGVDDQPVFADDESAVDVTGDDKVFDPASEDEDNGSVIMGTSVAALFAAAIMFIQDALYSIYSLETACDSCWQDS